jgi:hypothetical protein
VARDQVAAFTGEGGHAAVDGDSKSATAALWTREGHEARINWMHGSRGVALTGEGGGGGGALEWTKDELIA